MKKKENECNKIIDDFLNKNLIFNNNNINKINDLYKKIQKNIKQKFINYEIIYKIEEKDLKKNIENVKLNADFLNWSYKEMEKIEENKFIFRTKLLLGHCYYFCFYIKGDKKLSNDYEIKRLKKKNNLKYNYIEFKDENGNVQNDDNESEEEESEEDENEEEEDLFNINENKEFLDNY